MFLGTPKIPAENDSNEDDACIKTFPAGTVQFENLMRTFYWADVWDLAFGTLPEYNHWLKEKHDAHSLFSKLWSFITRYVAGGHYKMFDLSARRAIPPRVDFRQVTAVLAKACNKDISVKNAWPFYCTSHTLFCEYQDIIAKILSTYSSNPSTIYNPSVKYPLLPALYTEDLLRYASDGQLDDIVYYVMRHGIWAFSCRDVKTAMDHVIKEKPYVDGQCASNPSSPTSKHYFCKVKAIIDIFDECKQQEHSSCVFHPLIQGYFSKYSNVEEKTVLCMVEAAKTKVTEIYDAVQSNSLEINNIVNLLNRFVTVKDSVCQPNWRNICKGANLLRQNPLCQLQTLYRFDCTIKFILKQLNKKPFNDERRTMVQIWLSYPLAFSLHGKTIDVTGINRLIFSVQKSASTFITSYDNPSLKRFASDLPPGGYMPSLIYKKLCDKDNIEIAYRIYCYINPVLDDVSLYLNVVDNSRNQKVRTIIPTINYITLMGQMQLERVQAFLTKQVEHYVGQLSAELQANFAGLSNYFSSIARYDSEKYVADIGYIQNRLEKFESKITTLNNEVQTLFGTTLKIAISANALELATLAYQLGVSIVKASNPVAAVFGDFDYNDLLDRISNLAQAGVETAILARLHNSEFPSLKTQAIELAQAFQENTKNLTAARLLVASFQNKDKDIGSQAQVFLEKYSAYDPQVQLSDITSYSAKWGTVAEQVCEAAFAGGTFTSALLEIGLASTGDCNKIKVKISELTTVYEEMYQYQFDLMDSLSDATRAYLANEKAVEMKSVYTSEKRVDNAFLSKVAVRSYVISIIHVWKVVTDYCNVLTYKSGGQEPSACRIALTAPTHVAVADVMSLNPPDACNSNNQYESYRAIPIKLTTSMDTASVDLGKLYKGEEVIFSIPNVDWLKENDWLPHSVSPKAIFVTRFELYFPPMSGNAKHTIRIRVQPNIANYLMEHSGTKYLLQLPSITNSYAENGGPCYKESTESPYAINDPKRQTKLCIVSDGYIQGDLKPSIFNEWKIKVTDMPPNEVAPANTANFKLQAAVSYCLIENPKDK